MKGADSLIQTLVEGGVEVCFANPGTSEMQFVGALDQNESMRGVLCLFEGVASAAGDGYARMAEKPAATLLHLGPGLGNALANLHNAKKARSPIVNIVGEHATYHVGYNTPLTSDIEGIAAPVSDWVRTSKDAGSVGADTAEAIAAAASSPGKIATLIIPGDAAWNEGGQIGRIEAPQPYAPVPSSAVDAAAKILKNGEPALLLLGGPAVLESPLEMAGRIAVATGCHVLAECMNARMQRGAGRLAVRRLPYPAHMAREILKDYKHIILVGATEPYTFFAYPNQPSALKPEGCCVLTLAAPEEDSVGALEALVEAVGAKSGTARLNKLARPPMPTGPITSETIALALTALMPENSIVVDESITTGFQFPALTADAPPNDWLQNRGGAIGIGLPVATGAAIACPDRKVICLESDGSGMYCVQSLWTQARESTDVTTLVFANHSYNVLKTELANVGARNAGPKALDMINLDRPALSWVDIATGMGVDAERVDSSESLYRAMENGFASDGPYLIEVLL